MNSIGKNGAQGLHRMVGNRETPHNKLRVIGICRSRVGSLSIKFTSPSMKPARPDLGIITADTRNLGKQPRRT